MATYGMAGKGRSTFAGGAIAALLMLILTSAGVDANAYPKLFGTDEVASSDNSEFKKWIDMLDRHFAEEERGDMPCDKHASRAVCAIQEWLTFIEQERGRDKLTQLREVNAHLNLHRYVLDIVNYGDENHWGTPREFSVNGGQCEEYAIAKYFTLRKLGWDMSALRVVVLQDLNLGVAHAVTVAYLSDTAYVLDNLIPVVVTADTIHHYHPFYSINEQHWWLHVASH